MTHIADLIWHRLPGLMPGELRRTELGWLVAPHEHSALLARRRATLIVNRVRLLSFLFAVMTPLWSVIDFVVFPFPLWINLAMMRLVACAAFVSLLIHYRPNGDLLDAYRSLALLFAIATVFYVASHILLTNYRLVGLSATIGAGYAFLPFALVAALSIFPLTLLENVILAIPILILQFVAGYVRLPTVDWPSFAGALWLLMLIAGVPALAGVSQLAFMIALVRQAVRDPLTGVFSRGSGEEVVELQFSIASRSGAPLSVAFIDIDHFKGINDRFGHGAGDRVLINMAEIINRNLRRGDVLVRWGGEEFILIMPNTDLEKAEAAITRLRNVGFGLRPDNVRVTASIGIAERTDMRADDWKALVDKADQRMYHAKQSGRDRVNSGD
jgi:diguanylate cyclase (GGDEF)-like protein